MAISRLTWFGLVVVVLALIISIASLVIVVVDRSERITDLESRLTKIRNENDERLADLESQMMSSTKYREELDKQWKDHISAFKNLTNIVKGSKGKPIAFSMGRIKSVTYPTIPTVLKIIPLDVVIFNEGGHFNKTDNMFYAPQDGVYSFSFSGLGLENRPMNLGLYTLKNNGRREMIARAGDYNGPGGSAASGGSGATIIIRLEKGKRISLWGTELYGHNILNSGLGPSTLFSGMLVSQ